MVIYPLIWVKFYSYYFLNVKRSHWSPPPHLPRDPHPPQLQGKVHHHQPQSSSWRSSHNTLALRENQFLTQLTSSSKIGIGWDLWAGLCNYYNIDNKSNLDDPHLALGSAWSASNFRSASSPSSNRCLDLANLPPPPPPPAHYRFHNHICGAWSQWFSDSKISWEVYEWNVELQRPAITFPPAQPGATLRLQTWRAFGLLLLLSLQTSSWRQPAGSPCTLQQDPCSVTGKPSAGVAYALQPGPCSSSPWQPGCSRAIQPASSCFPLLFPAG